MDARKRWTLLAVLAALSVGMDQVTKRIAVGALQSTPPQSYLADLFRLQYAENQGAFLSLGADLPEQARSWLFTGAVGVLLAGMLSFALFSGRLKPLEVAGLALFVGGGFSNWIDRLLHGGMVIDFMNVGIGPLRSGVFNVADLFVIGGALLFALGLSSSRARHENCYYDSEATDRT